MTEFSQPLCVLHQNCYLKVLLWLFPAPRGKLSPWACGTLQFWIYSGSNSDWAEPIFPTRYSKDTRLTAPNKAHQISDPHGCHRQKRQSFIIREAQKEAALTQGLSYLWGEQNPASLFSVFVFVYEVGAIKIYGSWRKTYIYEDYILHIYNFKEVHLWRQLQIWNSSFQTCTKGIWKVL